MSKFEEKVKSVRKKYRSMLIMRKLTLEGHTCFHHFRKHVCNIICKTDIEFSGQKWHAKFLTLHNSKCSEIQNLRTTNNAI
jgi:hypothetical protein